MAGARDGQLRIRRGQDSPPWALQMFDDDLGLWLTLAQANVEEDLMLAGVPILRGPYSAHYTDFLHDGDTFVLWTPAAGDILLTLFTNFATLEGWDHGAVNLGVTGNETQFAADMFASPGPYTLSWPYPTLFDGTASVLVQLDNPSLSPDPTQGHVDLYALVTRAVAP